MLDWNAIAAASGPVLVAVAAGIFTWLAGRGRNRIDGQAMLNAGFDALVRDLREDRSDLLKECSECREENRKLRAYVRLLETEFNKNSLRLPNLEGD